MEQQARPGLCCQGFRCRGVGGGWGGAAAKAACASLGEAGPRACPQGPRACLLRPAGLLCRKAHAAESGCDPEAIEASENLSQEDQEMQAVGSVPGGRC